jgi:hypothetical protein
MSGYLDHLVQRTLGVLPTLQPELRSRFEPAPPGDLEVDQPVADHPPAMSQPQTTPSREVRRAGPGLHMELDRAEPAAVTQDHAAATIRREPTGHDAPAHLAIPAAVASPQWDSEPQSTWVIGDPPLAQPDKPRTAAWVIGDPPLAQPDKPRTAAWVIGDPPLAPPDKPRIAAAALVDPPAEATTRHSADRPSTKPTQRTAAGPAIHGDRTDERPTVDERAPAIGVLTAASASAAPPPHHSPTTPGDTRLTSRTANAGHRALPGAAAGAEPTDVPTDVPTETTHTEPVASAALASPATEFLTQASTAEQRSNVDGGPPPMRRDTTVDSEPPPMRRDTTVDSEPPPMRRDTTVDSKPPPTRRDTAVDSETLPIRRDTTVDSETRPAWRDTALPQQADGSPVPPKVTVVIGRVEVRPPPAPPPAPEPPPGPQPLSLDEYLDRRAGGSR